MRYVIKKRCLSKINTFYRNVSKKYKHTYSEELMHQNIDEAIDAMYQIEQTLLRREPTLERWKGYYMANTDKWYFAYTIEGDTITIVDACHAQNMHNKRSEIERMRLCLATCRVKPCYEKRFFKKKRYCKKKRSSQR